MAEEKTITGLTEIAEAVIRQKRAEKPQGVSSETWEGSIQYEIDKLLESMRENKLHEQLTLPETAVEKVLKILDESCAYSDKSGPLKNSIDSVAVGVRASFLAGIILNALPTDQQGTHLTTLKERSKRAMQDWVARQNGNLIWTEENNEKFTRFYLDGNTTNEVDDKAFDKQWDEFVAMARTICSEASQSKKTVTNPDTKMGAVGIWAPLAIAAAGAVGAMVGSSMTPDQKEESQKKEGEKKSTFLPNFLKFAGIASLIAGLGWAAKIMLSKNNATRQVG